MGEAKVWCCCNGIIHYILPEPEEGNDGFCEQKDKPFKPPGLQIDVNF